MLKVKQRFEKLSVSKKIVVILLPFIVLLIIAGFTDFIQGKGVWSSRDTVTNQSIPILSAPTTDVPQEEPQVVLDPLIYKFSGSDSKDTESFNLRGGSALLNVRVFGAEYGSFSAFRLINEEEGYDMLSNLTGNDITITTDDGEYENTTTSTVRRIEEGSYYISVISGISWEVTITQE